MREFAAEPPIEERIAEPLCATDATVATAESCTGGLIGSYLTDVPGSSDYFDRTLATYSYDSKMDLVGVSRETLDEHGAVSEPVARQMARGVRDTAGTTWGLSTTGIAGPDGVGAACAAEVRGRRAGALAPETFAAVAERARTGGGT